MQLRSRSSQGSPGCLWVPPALGVPGELPSQPWPAQGQVQTQHSRDEPLSVIGRDGRPGRARKSRGQAGGML